MSLIIVKLPISFYKEHAQDKEIMQKKDRPYIQGTILSDSNNVYFIPFRTYLPANLTQYHPEVVLPLKTRNKPLGGLDITKMVVLSQPEKIVVLPKTYIDREEYGILLRKQKELWNKAQNYIEEYKERVQTGKPLPTKYRYTTLKYFHDELGLSVSKKDKPLRNYRDPNFIAAPETDKAPGFDRGL